jgi:hypothetical protein
MHQLACCLEHERLPRALLPLQNPLPNRNTVWRLALQDISMRWRVICATVRIQIVI